MLFLLPPSETKRPGGVGVSVGSTTRSDSEQSVASEQIQAALTKLSAQPEIAQKALKLGKRNLGDLNANLILLTAPTMPALQRYTGVLFDALGYQSLSDQALIRANEQVFIQSALFGLVSASHPIPYYRLSAGSKLAGMNLAEIWTRAHRSFWESVTSPVLDLRSKAYVALNPIPADVNSYVVEVVDLASGRALNHFNKKAKGAFVRSALELGISELSEVQQAALDAGLDARFKGRIIELIVPAGF